MRTLTWKHLSLSVCALALIAGTSSLADAATCTPTGFFRDGINMTAALINPPVKVTGDVDATGCNIGVYYGHGAKGKIDQANVHGANYFGVVNQGADVDVTNSSISDIGEKPFNGTQHGVAIYYRGFDSATTGDIKGNLIWNYQKGGIVVNGTFAKSKIQQNYVIGLGAINFIAQNGIQAGYGAHTAIRQNLVTGNSYTGAGQTASGGIILVGGDCYGGAATTDTNIQLNVGLNNDIGIWLSNLDASCNAVSAPTNDNVRENQLVNNAINNTTGNGAIGYQAGIADQGSGDVIRNNDICGLGYTPPGTASAALFAIDVTATNNATVKNNTTCANPDREAEGDRRPRRWDGRPSHHH